MHLLDSYKDSAQDMGNNGGCHDGDDNRDDGVHDWVVVFRVFRVVEEDQEGVEEGPDGHGNEDRGVTGSLSESLMTDVSDGDDRVDSLRGSGRGTYHGVVLPFLVNGFFLFRR